MGSSTPEEVNDILSGDLSMTMAALKAHPKVYWIWNHRRWCLENVPGGPGLEGEIDFFGWKKANWDRELYVVEKMLDADARNCQRSLASHMTVGADPFTVYSSGMGLQTICPGRHARAEAQDIRIILHTAQDRSQLFEFQRMASTLQGIGILMGKRKPRPGKV